MSSYYKNFNAVINTNSYLTHIFIDDMKCFVIKSFNFTNNYRIFSSVYNNCSLQGQERKE